MNFLDLWGLEAGDQKQTVEVITSGIEVNLITVPDLSTGDLITVTNGFFDASFYIDDSKTPNFTARYTYTVTEKDGFEVTVLGLSLTAGQGTKTYDSPQTEEQIAKDFENAGTDSVTVGLTVVIGGSISGSTSGGWIFTQSSLGADGGVSVNVAGGTTHTETKLVEKSLKVRK
ncbi:MAG TPA: hypothetical protein VLZ83_08445 [Edaphocola sp.]|nr:hypothetical protein [Edaphocola sp.]